MIPMDLLMGAFHSGPWLKLISSCRVVPTIVDLAVANWNGSNLSAATQFRKEGLKWGQDRPFRQDRSERSVWAEAGSVPPMPLGKAS
jgi:hypothetical protein